MHIAFLLLFVVVVAVVSPTDAVHVRVDESPPIKLPLSATFNKDYAKNLLQNDRTRIRALIQNALSQSQQGTTKSGGLTPRSTNGPSDILATNNGIQYTVTVNIGAPASQYKLLIDTGSSNTWVGADKAYVPTSTSYKTKNNVSVVYGSGEFGGIEYLDQVALSPTLHIHNQSIGVATFSDGFDGIDGILGMGPRGLTIGTLSPDSSKAVATVTEKLYAQKSIPQESFSVYFDPTNFISNPNGALTFGGTDPSLYTGSIIYTPMLTEGAASKFWGVNQSIRYGSSKQIIHNGAGFYDTGTTLVLLTDDAFDTYAAAAGASLDPTTGLLRISEQQYSNLSSLYFDIGDTSLEFTANAQIWPRSLNTAIGGRNDSIYLIVSSLGSAANGAPDVQFVAGYTFLERFYTTYVLSSKQIGIARTNFTYAETN